MDKYIQTLDEAACISHNAYILGKYINLPLLSLDLSK